MALEKDNNIYLHRLCDDNDKIDQSIRNIHPIDETDTKSELEDECGRNALHLAVLKGDHQSVSMLISERKFSVVSVDDKGNTPLHYALSKKRKKSILLLLNNGADPFLENAAGFSPLHYAQKSGLYKFLRKQLCISNQSIFSELFISAATDGIQNQQYIMEYLGYPSVDINDQDKDLNTALHHVAKKGDDQMVALLLELGANPHIRNKYGNTALHHAAMSGSASAITCVRLLANYGANIDVQNTVGLTPLHMAARMGRVQMVITLCEVFNANVEIKDSKDNSPHAFVNKYGFRHVGSCFEQKHNVILQYFDYIALYGVHFLHCAILDHHPKHSDTKPFVLKVLRKIPEMIDQQCHIELLLSRGIDPKVVETMIFTEGEYGLTPLTLATYFGWGDMQLLLLERGAVPSPDSTQDYQSNTVYSRLTNQGMVHSRR